MKTVLVGCIVVVGVLAGVLAHAVEPLVLYDDFNAEQIDAGKWVREEDGAGIKPIVQLQDNRLRLLNRSYGKTDSDKGQDSGGQRIGSPRGGPMNPSPPTQRGRRWRWQGERHTCWSWRWLG